MLGNDLATLPDFPAEIRAPAGTLGRACRRSRSTSPSRDILTPGDTPNVLVAMNPAALKANLAALERGGDDHRQRGRVHRARPAEGRLRGQPARGRLARRLPRQPRPDDLARPAARSRASRASRRATRRRPRTCSRSALLSWLYDRPTDGHRAVDRARSSAASRRVLEANLAAFRAGWSFGETAELIDVQYEVDAGDRRRARHLPQRQRHAGDRARADRRERAQRAAAVPRRYPITPASELLHELSRHQALGVRTIQAEDEIAAAGDGARRRVRRRARRHGHERPGHGPQGGDDRPRRDARAADGRSSTSSAPGPSTGMPTKTEQSRPAAGALRPPRRVAAAGRRRRRRPAQCFEAVDRGGADRRHATARR